MLSCGSPEPVPNGYMVTVVEPPDSDEFDPAKRNVVTAPDGSVCCVICPELLYTLFVAAVAPGEMSVSMS